MHAPVSFQDFVAASPYTDPVDKKKLLFVYRAVEDFAAERRVSASELSMLEVACGAGGITLPLARLGARVRALDTDGANVDRMLGRARELHLDQNLTAAAEDAFTFRHDARYDVMVASEVVEHVPDPDALLANVVRHLAPDGLVIVTTRNGYGPRDVSSPSRPQRAPRQRHYTRATLFTLFHRHGLRVHRFMNSGFVLTASKHTRAHPTLGTFDADLANLVPHWMASGWYLTLRKTS